jgi:protein farnesyltransferase/geranylgeranyltransferase type-1 subunit alpha
VDRIARRACLLACCWFLLFPLRRSQPFFARPSARELQAAEAGGADPQHADVFAAELVYLARLLDADVRNNSAWNQRFFVRTHAHGSGSALAWATPASADWASRPPVAMSPAVLHEELSFTGAKILLAPQNESPWNYLEGLMRQQNFDESHRKEMMQIVAALHNEETEKEKEQEKEGDLEARAAALPNRFAQSLLVELWQHAPATAASSFPAPRLDLARSACQRLAAELDPLRSKYWLYRLAQIDQPGAGGGGSGTESSPAAGEATKQ